MASATTAAAGQSHKFRAMEQFKLGFDMLRQGKDVKEAIRLLEDAIRLRPRVARYHYVAGNGYRALERFQQAFRHYSQAVELDDKEPLYFASRGVCLRKLRRFGDALKDLSIAVDMDPGEVSHWFNRGLVHYERDDLALAEQDFSQCCDAPARDSKYAYRALYNRANCRRRMGVHALAIDDLRAAVSLEPTNAAASDALGLVYCDVGDFEAALRSFNRALDVVPGHWAFLTHKGLALYHLGRLEEARSELDLAVRVQGREAATSMRPLSVPGSDARGVPFPLDAEAFFHRSNVALAQGDLGTAAADAATAVASALEAVRREAGVRGGGSAAVTTRLGSSTPVSGRRSDGAAGGAEAAEDGGTGAGGRRQPGPFVGRESAAVAAFRPQVAEHAPRGVGARARADASASGAVLTVAAVPLPTDEELRASSGAGPDAAAALTRRLHSAGLVFQAAGAWPAAERCFAAAVAVDSGHLASRYHRALMLHVMGWHAPADAELGDVLERATEHAGSGSAMPPGSQGGVALDAPMARPAARRKLLEARGLVRQALGLHETALQDLDQALLAMDEQQREVDEAALAAQAADSAHAALAAPAWDDEAAAGGGGGVGGDGEDDTARHDGTMWFRAVPDRVRGECHYHRSVSLLSLDPPRVEDALASLREAVGLGFGTPEAWDKVAAAQLMLGRVPAAVRAYAECIEAAPDRPHFFVRRAQCLREVGDSEAAIEDLTAALERLRPGEDQGAPRAAFESHRGDGPDVAAARAEHSLRGADGALSIGSAANADARGEQSSDDAVERGRVLFIRGLCHYDVDDFEGAAADYREALLCPLPASMRGSLLFASGIAQANSDDYEAAEASFRGSLAADPGAPTEELVQRLHERAKALQMLERHEEAARVFGSVLERSPHNGERTRGRGATRLPAGRAHPPGPF